MRGSGTAGIAQNEFLAQEMLHIIGKGGKVQFERFFHGFVVEVLRKANRCADRAWFVFFHAALSRPPSRRTKD